MTRVTAGAYNRNIIKRQAHKLIWHAMVRKFYNSKHYFQMGNLMVRRNCASQIIPAVRYCYLFKLLSNPTLNLMLMLDPSETYS